MTLVIKKIVCRKNCKWDVRGRGGDMVSIWGQLPPPLSRRGYVSASWIISCIRRQEFRLPYECCWRVKIKHVWQPRPFSIDRM